MSMSAIDKIDALSTKSAPVKSSGFDSAFYGYGGYIPSGDLPRDEYGAAAAYAVMAEVFAALAVWETNLDGVTWIVKDRKSGQEIARTDVQEYPITERGGKWYRAIKQHERRYYHSFFKSLAYSDWLFGKSYVAMLEAERQYRPNSTNYTGLKWLNPLNTHAMTVTGRIEYFQYTGLDADGYTQIMPNAMAYRINRRNAFDDLDGYSGVLAAMDSINLSRNTIRAFKNYFAQGMQLGGVIMPDGDDVLGSSEHESARREFEHGHKGTVNAGRWAILRKRMTITPFGQENNIASNFTVSQDLRNTIFMALNVPPQLAGDPSNATYDNADDIRRQWLQLFFIPYVKDIAGYNSDVVIPKLEPEAGVYIEADTSPYEIEKPEVISQDVSAGVIDIATAQARRGYKVDSDLKDIFLINNVPMSKAIIRELANRIPSQYALDYAQAATAGSPPNVNADMVNTVKSIEKPLPEGWTEENAVGNEAEIEAALNNAVLEKAHKHSHLPPITSADNVSELEELASWRKFCMNGKAAKRPFEQKALRGDIGDLIQLAVESQDKHAILSAFHAAQERIEKRIKAIQDTQLGYERDFNELLSRARSERMARPQWASAMRAIERRYVRRAYIDGMVSGGVEDEPSEDDLIAMNEISASNSGYITELGNVLYKEDGVTDSQADVKATMWWNKSVFPAYQAGLLSADANGLYEWVYGDTEHCEDCKRLNGQRHRLKGWKANYLPKSSDLACQGYFCACQLVKAKGRARGTY